MGNSTTLIYKMMLYKIFFVLIVLYTLNAKSQQRIFFINKENPEKKVAIYKLLQHVTCTFNNGEKQSLVLEKVIGDTLIFEPFQYSSEHPTYLFSNLKKVYFHKKGEHVLKIITLGFAGVSLTSLVGFFIAANQLRQSSENGGDIGILFLPPFALITGTIAGLVYTTLPKSYKSKNHQIFIKQ
jgi:hypothetical protein